MPVRLPVKAILAGLVLALQSAAPAAAQGGPSGVATDWVEARAVSETVPVFAEIVATRESGVAVRVAGVVDEVMVRVGEVVEAGQALARLDTELLEIELNQSRAATAEAEAGVEVANATLILGERGFARVEGLRGTNAFSQGAFDDREGAVAQARGQLAQARARLASAEAAAAEAAYNLDRATIRAPFHGAILEVALDSGEYVQPGSLAATLVDIRDVEVEAAVPARYIAALSTGQQIDGQTEDGDALRLTVRALLPTESTATRTRPVRLTADLGQAATPVAIGQSVTVQIPVTEARDALLVPKDALIQGRGGWQAFVHEDGKAVPRDVAIGASFGPGFEVVSGLAAGDEVVVRGNERLRPGQEIAPDPVRPAPGAAVGAAAGADGAGDGADASRTADASGTAPDADAAAPVAE